MEAGTTSTTLTARLPILNPGELISGLMRKETILSHADYSLWKLQKLISQLEIQGEVITQEDMDLKLLRCVPFEWKTHALI
ncbi:hypothetical protein Tco_0175149 [Tanacetum coccineum]